MSTNFFACFRVQGDFECVWWNINTRELINRLTNKMESTERWELTYIDSYLYDFSKILHNPMLFVVKIHNSSIILTLARTFGRFCSRIMHRFDRSTTLKWPIGQLCKVVYVIISPLRLIINHPTFPRRHVSKCIKCVIAHLLKFALIWGKFQPIICII